MKQIKYATTENGKTTGANHTTYSQEGSIPALNHYIIVALKH